MKTVRTKYVSGAFISGAFLCAAIAFPSIAAKASAHREASNLETLVEAIDLVDAGQVQDTPLIARLTELQVNPELSPLMRDASLTRSLLSYTRSDVETAFEAQRELQCLSEAVYYEARSETRSGQKAVAEVVMNRVASKHYPDTVCGVVYQGSDRNTGCQFSFTCDGSMDNMPKGKPWERARDVAELVLTGGVKPFTDNATHYHTTSVTPFWSKSMRMTRRVGSHVFYRFAPRNYEVSTPSHTVAPPT